MSAAPSQSPVTFNIEDVLFDGMKDDITFDKMLKALKCMRDVIGNVIGDGDLKPVYEEYKMKAETVVKNDLMKCRDLEGTKFLYVWTNLIFRLKNWNNCDQLNNEFVFTFFHTAVSSMVSKKLP